MDRGREELKKLQNNNNVNPSSSSRSKSPYSLLDPNSSLIDENGNLVNDITKAATITTYRNGTIADGVSKLILLVDSDNTLQFSINSTKPDNLADGRLSSLNQSSNVNKLSSSVIVSSQNISNGKSVVAAVYTPPDSFNQDTESNRTINVNVSDQSNPADTLYELPIQLYRPPVVLVHGLWMNSDNTWIAADFTKTSFTKILDKYGFTYAFADYEQHNSETFDPYAIKTIGNYGIDSIRNTINHILNMYHYFSIAASQVDIVAHSMGGLMARGFVQQRDYKRKDNFMKGSIHRLITIGTPHFGGPLSKFLYDHRDDRYCFDENGEILPVEKCYNPIQLETSYENRNIPIDQGGIKSLIPESDAYSHLCQTNVKSYAIAGTWRPNANVSHEHQESDYKIITHNDDFDLDKDGFNGEDDNDLVVRAKSQLGGLPHQIRKPGNNGIPNKSAVYPNTVHTTYYIMGDDKNKTNVFSETNSPHIQEDVIALLKSSDNNKFANAIGIGSPCHPSK
jgi:triacylglycerol esterase/lipase EstA (alpha/beta hydrolase family)